jgi:hypothetical protein
MSYNVKDEIEALTNLISAEGSEKDTINRMTDLFEEICVKLGFNFSYMLTKDDPTQGIKIVSRANIEIDPEVSDQVRFLNTFQHHFIHAHLMDDLDVYASKKLYEGIDLLFKETIEEATKNLEIEQVLDKLLKALRKDVEGENND